jgi:hypothetical protein
MWRCDRAHDPTSPNGGLTAVDSNAAERRKLALTNFNKSWRTINLEQRVGKTRVQIDWVTGITR